MDSYRGSTRAVEFTRDILAHYSLDGHCLKCGAMVGLTTGNPDPYSFMLLHVEWHNNHRHLGESVS